MGPMKPGKKIVACPQCSRRLSLQGLNGHLRFVHGVGADRVAATMERGTLEDRAARTLELMRRLKEIRQQRLELGKLPRRADAAGEHKPGQKRDAVHDAFEQAFERLEKEIVQELRGLEVLGAAEK